MNGTMDQMGWEVDVPTDVAVVVHGDAAHVHVHLVPVTLPRREHLLPRVIHASTCRSLI